MGIGHSHLRKLLKSETMWKDKKAEKHKCNFKEHCILKVIDKNNIVEYYNVMKCNQCLSFKSITEKGNIRGHISNNLTEEQKRLPIITGFCNNYYRIAFADLENVSYNKLNNLKNIELL